MRSLDVIKGEPPNPLLPSTELERIRLQLGHRVHDCTVAKRADLVRSHVAQYDGATRVGEFIRILSICLGRQLVRVAQSRNAGVPTARLL